MGLSVCAVHPFVCLYRCIEASKFGQFATLVYIAVHSVI